MTPHMEKVWVAEEAVERKKAWPYERSYMVSGSYLHAYDWMLQATSAVWVSDGEAWMKQLMLMQAELWLN